MTGAEPPLISLDELHAYVDGWLDPARRQQVLAYLKTQPDLARRVAAYREQREHLRGAFADVSAQPIPPELNLQRLVEARLLRRSAPWWRLAACVLLSLGLGGMAGWYLATAPSFDRNAQAMSLLRQQAMASHAVYTSDARHPIEIAAGDRAQLAQWLSNRLHRDVAPPDLSGLGYRLLGGRLLATERGGTAALFVYQDASGTRLSLVLRPMAPELRAGREDIAHGPVNACAWIANGMGYAVVAATTDAAIDQVADLISDAGPPHG
jgi:anti-sigma factor RsiW